MYFYLNSLFFNMGSHSLNLSKQLHFSLCSRFIFRKLKDRIGLLRAIGQQEFDMPKNVMDVLYNQALCWIGIFFSPFIPLFITAKLFLFFWIKRVRFIFCQNLLIVIIMRKGIDVSLVTQSHLQAMKTLD